MNADSPFADEQEMSPSPHPTGTCSVIEYVSGGTDANGVPWALPPTEVS